MAVTTRTENVEQEAPSRPPRWIGWTVVWATVAALIGAGAVVWTASNQALIEPTSPGLVTLSSDLERYTVMSDDVLRQHLVERGLIPSAAVPSLSTGRVVGEDPAYQGVIPGGAVPSLSTGRVVGEDPAYQGVIPGGAVPSLSTGRVVGEDPAYQGVIPEQAVPVTELERWTRELEEIKAEVATELERYQQMSDDQLRQHLIDRGLIPSAPVSAP